MHLLYCVTVLFSLHITHALASLLTGTYPAPIDLSSNKSLVATAWKDLSRTFDNYLGSKPKGNATETFQALKNITFSTGLFSIHDRAAALLQYHHTSPEIAKAPNGTNKVNGDSIYRVASVSKLVTVFAGLLRLTEEDWSRPLTEFIPELATPSIEDSPAYTIAWDEVTPYALAHQLAGLPQFGIPAADLLFAAIAAGTDLTAIGVPALNISVLGPCLDLECSPATYAESIRSQPPTLLPWTDPVYSDNAFILLGMVIEKVTGMRIGEVYQQSIFDPLGMKSSFSDVPTQAGDLARSVITDITFYLQGGFSTPSGGIFASLNDLDKFGIAILNSTLLPANATRKWMHPTGHTASLSYSVGGPWEILRYVHPSSGKVTDLYTKLGDSGSNGGALIAIPEYGAGISFAGAYSDGVTRSLGDNVILDYVLSSILPALEAQAAEEARRNFAGTYVSTDPKLNSSVTITLDKSTAPGKPRGLSISRWISNGTNALGAEFGTTLPFLNPSIPKQKSGSGQVVFQASTYLQTNSYLTAPASAQVIGPFTGSYNTNADWFAAGNQFYGNIGVKMLVFDVDANGKATALSPAVTRVKLQRKA